MSGNKYLEAGVTTRVSLYGRMSVRGRNYRNSIQIDPGHSLPRYLFLTWVPRCGILPPMDIINGLLLDGSKQKLTGIICSQI